MLESAVVGVDQGLRKLSGVKDVKRTKSPEGYPVYRILGREGDGADLCPAVYSLARDEGWPVRELRPDVRTLETVFNELAMAA